MSRIRAVLRRITHRLTTGRSSLAISQRRYRANRKRAYVAHDKQIKAQEKAYAYLQFGLKENQPKAEVLTKEAARYGHIAHRNHLRAQFWLGRIKQLQQRIHGLEFDQKGVEAELRKWRREHGVRIVGNKVTG